jgi:glycosyltransferase involved in cell wall biosynthesis
MFRQVSPIPVKARVSSPLRVLIALPGLHRVTRGAEVALEELARNIAVRPDFAVTLLGTGPARGNEPYRYLQTRCIRRERFEGWPRIPFLRHHFGYEELTFMPGLIRNYRPEDFDVTMTCGYPYTNWALRAGHGSHTPKHVYVTQNGDGMITARKWEFRYFGCDGLVCTNPDYYERHRHSWPSILIPNGVNAEVFHPGPRDRRSLGLAAHVPVALMVSALSPSKRVLEGIRCAARVPGLFLVIAGEGELRDQVRTVAEQLLPGRHQMMAVPRSRMPQLYRDADVFLHMSQDEPSSNAYIEALATGLPIVTHDRPVTRWTFEDQAILVNTSHEAAVADGIAAALAANRPADVRARRELAQRRFAWSSIADRYCEFFEAIHQGALA